MKKLTILVIVVSLIAFLYGCCSHSDSGVFVNPQGDAVISQRTVVIDEYGRLPTVSFPSGTIVSGAEENTLQPGIKVILTEQEVNSKYLGYFSESDNTQLYEYKITAYQESSDIAGNKTYVSTIEKPYYLPYFLFILPCITVSSLTSFTHPP